ncbi:hypothetical protein EXN66_Car007924 [Channa argus]|uniref:Uncharacterized protein n=1 Tax=Channa argus TaxID=215402 RepID=A0A6G1PQI8_CHAAH|nr:hypothetical protein EXN66_Car007924 [Channa argus]
MVSSPMTSALTQCPYNVTQQTSSSLQSCDKHTPCPSSLTVLLLLHADSLPSSETDLLVYIGGKKVCLVSVVVLTGKEARPKMNEWL